MICWGRDFSTSATPTKKRMVQLMNNTACILEYDTSGTGTLSLINATLNNLGIANFDYLTTGETLVAKIFLTYKV